MSQPNSTAFTRLLECEQRKEVWKSKRQRKRERRKRREAEIKANPQSELNILKDKQHRMPWKRWYQMYLKSEHWKAIRQMAFEKHGKRCESCDSCSNLQVHHKNYRCLFKEKAKDLAILCKGCHKAHHEQGKNNLYP